MKLLTSNSQKISEYNRFGLGIEALKGIDIPEVDADILTVALYKALEAPKNCIIEDTSLDVEGEDIGVNIRWMVDSLKKTSGKKASWNVVIGVHDGEYVKLYSSSLTGIIDCSKNNTNAIGFDGIFIPDNSDLSLYELDLISAKDHFSPRKMVVEKFLKDDFTAMYKIKNIPEWKGKWQ